ncbi:hypothetical protein HMF8227_01227 [Saliniradius amylolyticus]|uniref:Secreted protein n=1 Tax=Saliniradius amylolyticus TaxID=2183582 RepID=A0A2S2E243_9ALTE|nr:hypothetical protein [Saliniradius amylolyticus]AWL11708.1 hypothetical protein HMF8227_01227 [Saliniradius amylolyticus]
MKSVIYLLAAATLTTSTLTYAGHTDYARVYRVEPIYTSDHKRHCYSPHPRHHSKSNKHRGSKHHGRITINRERGPSVRYHSGHRPHHTPQTGNCYKTQYRVWYYYQGLQFQSVMPFHPGGQLRIRIDITPLVHGY